MEYIEVEIFILIAVHMDLANLPQVLLEAYIHKFMLIYQLLFIDKKRDCIINLFSFLYIILQQRFVLVDHDQFLLHHSQQFDLLYHFVSIIELQKVNENIFSFFTSDESESFSALNHFTFPTAMSGTSYKNYNGNITL